MCIVVPGIATYSARSRPDEIEDHRERIEDALNVHDTRLVANALFTQRPLIFESDEWPAYRRVCASLVRLFAYELAEGGEFESVEFLRHCGLSLKDAEEIARRPGDFIRRSEDAQADSP